MKRTAAIGFLAAFLALPAGSGLQARPESPAWRDLFAADLTNALCQPGEWSWKDGILSPRDKDEVIWTKEEYENFTVDLEFQLEPGGNSGVLIYGADIQNWPANSIEIQLLDDGAPKWATIPPNWKCGGIFGHSAPLKVAVKKPGEWNRMTIRCRGSLVSVVLNGELVTDVNMELWKSGKAAPDGSAIVEFEPRPLAELATKGRIGLQGAHGGVATHFRKIRIKKLEEYQFDTTISCETLENFLSRAITQQDLLLGRGDFGDNLRMLRAVGAKFIGRSLCLWGRESVLLRNLEIAKERAREVHRADPDMILQSCIFEIVTREVTQVPVPAWAFEVFGLPVASRNFDYDAMLYADGRCKDIWFQGGSIPDVSREETMLYFYFLGVSFIEAGCEAIHLGQVEQMARNDAGLDHYARVLGKLRDYAALHARRRMVLFDAHVPGGGLVRNGLLLLDFHSFPSRPAEVEGQPECACLRLGYADSLYGRSKGGRTFSGWSCEHLPYLVELDNFGLAPHPGQPHQGIYVWGYDEMAWFARQSAEDRANFLSYADAWVRRTDPAGHLQMPGSRILALPQNGEAWYYANRPSPAVPHGWGDEDVIGRIWETQ